MTDEGFKRKLSAILSADVAGYSRLMAEDEAATVKTMASYREIMSSLIKQHRGRVVDSPGDNVLAEFSSVVDAVQCAVTVQNEFQIRNAELPENRRMEFRIGINLGDVIDEENRLYGDGVNISARLEALANAGGVCISGTAFDQVKGKLSLGYRFVGEQTVKNIPDPIRVYKVLMNERDAGKLIGVGKKSPKSRWAEIAAIVVFVAIGLVIYQFYVRSPTIEPASVEKMAYPLPDKPSIAVLPFDNLSGDPEQDYFSDGLTEDIITALSKIGNMFVIARNTAFTYKGKPVKVKQVAEDLGVRYVLEGSVRKAGDRVRITAQLIDAITSGHVWSERYDKKLIDIFALQDEITKNIMSALQIKLTDGEEARLYAEGTDNLDAYMKYLQGRKLIRNLNKEDNAQGRQLIKEAIALDPNYASAYYTLSGSYFSDIIFGASKSPKESMMMAIKNCQKAITLDDTLSTAHAWLGFLYANIRKYDEGIALCEHAVELGPSNSTTYRHLAMTLRYAGRWEEASMASLTAIRLDPFPASGTLYGLGLAYAFTGKFEKAIEACQKATTISPNDLLSHMVLAAIYGMADRIDEAKTVSVDVMRIEPKFSAEQFVKRLKWKRKDDIEYFLKALKKAGL
jgi:adenylate cyclase